MTTPTKRELEVLMTIDFDSLENNNDDIKKDVKEKMKRAKKEHDRLSKLPEGTFLSDDEEEPTWISKKVPILELNLSKKNPILELERCYWCNKKFRKEIIHYKGCKYLYHPIRKLLEKGTPLSTAWKEVLTIEKNKWISKGNRTGREPTEENLDQWFSAWCFLNRAPTNLKR